MNPRTPETTNPETIIKPPETKPPKQLLNSTLRYEPPNPETTDPKTIVKPVIRQTQVT